MRLATLPSASLSSSYADFQAPSEELWQHFLNQLSPQSSSSPPNSPPLQTLSLPDRNPFLGESPLLLGSDQEIRRIREKLQASNHCSLVGPPGSGKSFLLRTVQKDIPVWLGCQPQAVLSLPFRGIYNLRELQETIVQALGGQKAGEWRSLLRSKPLRLLILDDLGVMDPRERGLSMRSWLRGLDDSYSTKLLMVSNERLEVLFRQDDPNRDSPLAGLDPTPVQLAPLSSDACRQLVEQRITGSSLTVDRFADLFTFLRQPKELLTLCAERYETLQHS